MSIECRWNDEITSKIQIFDIWSVRKKYPLIQNVIFQCSISGYLGSYTQLLWERTKVENSIENGVSGVCKYVFKRKWCAALSSVVCPGGPSGKVSSSTQICDKKYFRLQMTLNVNEMIKLHQKSKSLIYGASEKGICCSGLSIFSVQLPGIWAFVRNFSEVHKSWKFIRFQPRRQSEAPDQKTAKKRAPRGPVLVSFFPK